MQHFQQHFLLFDSVWRARCICIAKSMRSREKACTALDDKRMGMLMMPNRHKRQHLIIFQNWLSDWKKRKKCLHENVYNIYVKSSIMHPTQILVVASFPFSIFVIYRVLGRNLAKSPFSSS